MLGNLILCQNTRLLKFPAISLNHNCVLLKALPFKQCYYYRPSSTHSSSQQEQLNEKKTGFKKAVALIKAFTLGTKKLYYDIKRMRQLSKRHGKLTISNRAPLNDHETTSFPFTREEVQFIYQTKRSLIIMLPTVTLFMVPLVGYVAPLIAFLFPQYLLTHHFWLDDMKKQLESKQYDSRLKQVAALSATLGKYGFHSHQFSPKDMQSIATRLPSLGQLERSDLAMLSAGWSFTTWFPKAIMQAKLEHHLNYIFLCDWLATYEGLSSLSEIDARMMCMERGLQAATKDSLVTWLNISTQFKECPTTLLAHLPTLLMK